MHGDFDWANEFLERELGDRWAYDDWGQGKLDVGLYSIEQGWSLSAEVSQAAYDDFIDYMWEEYGYDFEELFDWDAYREWYDSQ